MPIAEQRGSEVQMQDEVEIEIAHNESSCRGSRYVQCNLIRDKRVGWRQVERLAGGRELHHVQANPVQSIINTFSHTTYHVSAVSSGNES